MKQIIVGAVLAVALFNTPVHSAEQKFHSLNTLTPDELYALTPRELAKSLIKMEIHDIMDLTRLEMVYIDRATAEKRYNSGLLKYLHPARVLDADMRNLPSLQKKLSDLRRYYPAYSDYGTLEKIKKRMKGGAWASKQEFIKFRIRLVKDFHGQSVKNFDKYTKSGGKEGYDSYKNARKDLSLIDLIKAEEAEEAALKKAQEAAQKAKQERPLTLEEQLKIINKEKAQSRRISQKGRKKTLALLMEREIKNILKTKKYDEGNIAVYEALGLNAIFARGVRGSKVRVGVIGFGTTQDLIGSEFGNRDRMVNFSPPGIFYVHSQQDYSTIVLSSIIGAGKESKKGDIHGIAPKASLHTYALPYISKEVYAKKTAVFDDLVYTMSKTMFSQHPVDVVALAPNVYKLSSIASALAAKDVVVVSSVTTNAYEVSRIEGFMLERIGKGKFLLGTPIYKAGSSFESVGFGDRRTPYLYVVVGEKLVGDYRTFQWKKDGTVEGYSAQVSGLSSEAQAGEAAIGILAGAAALVREAYPDLKASQVVQLLMQTARDIGKSHKLLDLPAAFKPVGARKVLKLESLDTKLQGLREIARLRVLKVFPDLLLLSPSFGDAIGPGVLTIKVFDDFPSIYRYFTQDLSAGFTIRQAGPSALLNLMGSLDTIEGGKSYVGGLAFSLFKPKRAFTTTATRTQERTKLSDMGMQLAYTLGNMEYRLGLGLGASRLPHSRHAPSFVRTHAQGQYLNEVLSLSVRPLVVAGGSVRFGVVRGKGKTLGFSAQDKVGGGTRAYTSYMKAFGSAIAYAEVGYIKEETGVMGSFGRGILAMAGSSSTYGSLHIVVRSRSLEAYAYGYISSTRVQETLGSYLSEFSVAWSRSFAVGLKRALGKRSALMGGVYMPLRSSMEARVWDFETSDNTLNLYKRAVTLAPSGVERVGYLGYTRRLSRGGELEFLGALRFDAGHIKGRTDHLMMLRFSKAF